LFSAAPPKTKESAVLKDASLAILAKEIGAEEQNGLAFAMLLNMPNTEIVNIANCASDFGLLGAGDNLKVETTRKCLVHWRNMRSGTKLKEKEKVREIERALKEIGKPEMADIIMERHSNNSELTPDAFASLG